jgi:predicted RNA binding protein YcfA (HicA-like mRNA interferase family)
MPELPKLSGRAIIKAFGRDGWELVRHKCSHMILVKEGSVATLSVPDHRESRGHVAQSYLGERINGRAVRCVTKK